MADTEETRALFREIMGMTNGGTAGGRGSMQIPNDIMDAMAGDAAQESMARESLIMEMRRGDARKQDPAFVSLDLMGMDPSNIDTYLSEARESGGKRSKPARKACCAKVGGVLDQIMGAGGEEVDNLELQGVKDRGKADPIGGVDSVAEASEENIFDFIAEEFSDWEHDNDCAFANPKFGRADSPLGESYGSRRPGLVRDALGLDEDAGMAPGKLKALHRMLKQKKAAKGLAGKEAIVFARLQKIIGGKDAGPKEEAYNMNPSKTAFALSSFMEAKGSPDGLIRQDYAGDMSRKQRDDNSEYPTDLMPVKGGGNKMAGELKPAKGAAGGHTPRYNKGADPIGEDENVGVSRTAFALSSFMESASQAETAKKKLAMRKGDAGELSISDRDDTRENLGGPLEKASGTRSALDVYDDGGKKARYEKDANPIGGAVPAQQSARRMKK